MEWMLMLAAAGLAYVLQELLYRRFWAKGLTAEIGFQEEAAVEGDCAYLKETVTNAKPLPLSVLHVKFQMDRSLRFVTEENMAVTDLTYRNDMFSVLPWQKITRTLHFTCQKRGYYSCSSVDLVAYDLFLTQILTTSQPTQTRLYVYPAPVDRKKLSLPFYHMLGTVLSRQRLNEDPFAFRGIREYQSFDSMREVNWKASAKSGTLLVNVYESTASQKVVILLNLEAERFWTDGERQEESIRIAASMMLEWMERGIEVALVSNGWDSLTKEAMWIPAGTGEEHKRTVLEHLSRLCYEGNLCAFEQLLGEQKREAESGNVLYLLISSNQREEMLAAFEELCQNSPESLWIAPLKKEEELYSSRCLRAVSMKWELERRREL
ncbi:MAG: DUF58 domain-containing protein [bacterium]|nr:DUF58 domain-containing protein [bacterium]